MKKEYYLFVKDERIEVKKEIYIEFNRLVSRQNYSTRKYADCAKPLDVIADKSVQIEEDVIKRILIEQLYHALKQLDDEEYNLIFELFFNSRSVHSLAKDWDVHPMTIHSRKTKILKKLKKMIRE